ncbi:MAG: hypothetical protein KAH12_01605 [Anaerolineales bacterium]|nr:hypothetical protein [Anaerolineales bacterium]
MRVAKSTQNLIILWLVWAAVIIGFQSLVADRFQPRRPDRVLEWTDWETAGPNVLKGRPYLQGEFMDHQVAWDSEYYLSIALGGYDDPEVFSIEEGDHEGLSLNYAFFPLYSLAIRLLFYPLNLFGLNPIATASLAGVLVSLLGTLGGMLALYDLTHEYFGKRRAFRSVFYLLIFPSAFFLAQVYSEGLFIGLTFGALALIRRKHWVGSSFLSFLAVWTRGVGVALILPLGLAWFREWQASGKKFDSRILFKGLLAVSPLLAYAIWSFSLGQSFNIVEHEYFGRGILALSRSWERWSWAVQQILGGKGDTAVYYAMEMGSILLALIAGLFTLRSFPGIALFSLASLIIPLTSGEPQSMVRYVLILPSIYLFLGKFSNNQIFDKVWTLISILMMGLLTTLFTFYFWVA